MLDADIEACFDWIDHSALMDRVRARVKDKRVLALVKAFLKAGVLTELGEQDTPTGTPQGGILSRCGMVTKVQRAKRVRHREPIWRVVRYADDFEVLAHGERDHVESLRDQIADVSHRWA